MDQTKNDNTTILIEYQKKQLAAENFKYYQNILKDYYIPSNKLLKKTHKELIDFRAELKKDYDLSPEFKHVPVFKYHNRLSAIINDFITEGLEMNGAYRYIGKELDRDIVVFIFSLESVKNQLTEQAFITHDDSGEVAEKFEKADAALIRVCKLSDEIIVNITNLLESLNVELNRDYSSYAVAEEDELFREE
ncbi:hypothetical protein MmiHf6_08460 [Methanimicrococcus hongohii]|uniref:Uncharacterized protein n=1 Tax=Methanimicrococcus hongohii TaxID=3028295 RepID=A0AA96VAR5_9EURY|nr:hypothetical protein [Methanimicrococcus sp. Hf6]WNY23537.1 hypothetical protein MmiHf6_08460 [Methanimicrococcus sp. Hf6]